MASACKNVRWFSEIICRTKESLFDLIEKSIVLYNRPFQVFSVYKADRQFSIALLNFCDSYLVQILYKYTRNSLISHFLISHMLHSILILLNPVIRCVLACDTICIVRRASLLLAWKYNMTFKRVFYTIKSNDLLHSPSSSLSYNVKLLH